MHILQIIMHILHMHIYALLCKAMDSFSDGHQCLHVGLSF